MLASLVSGKIIHKKTRNFDRTAQNIYANFSINLWNLYRTCPQGWSYKAKNDPKVKLSPFPSARLRKYIWDACAEMISNQACMWWTFDVLINPDPRVLIYQRSFYKRNIFCPFYTWTSHQKFLCNSFAKFYYRSNNDEMIKDFCVKVSNKVVLNNLCALLKFKTGFEIMQC